MVWTVEPALGGNHVQGGALLWILIFWWISPLLASSTHVVTSNMLLMPQYIHYTWYSGLITCLTSSALIFPPMGLPSGIEYS